MTEKQDPGSKTQDPRLGTQNPRPAGGIPHPIWEKLREQCMVERKPKPPGAAVSRLDKKQLTEMLASLSEHSESRSFAIETLIGNLRDFHPDDAYIMLSAALRFCPGDLTDLIRVIPFLQCSEGEKDALWETAIQSLRDCDLCSVEDGTGELLDGHYRLFPERYWGRLAESAFHNQYQHAAICCGLRMLPDIPEEQMTERLFDTAVASIRNIIFEKDPKINQLQLEALRLAKRLPVRFHEAIADAGIRWPTKVVRIEAAKFILQSPELKNNDPLRSYAESEVRETLKTAGKRGRALSFLKNTLAAVALLSPVASVAISYFFVMPLLTEILWAKILLAFTVFLGTGGITLLMNDSARSFLKQRSEKLANVENHLKEGNNGNLLKGATELFFTLPEESRTDGLRKLLKRIEKKCGDPDG